MYARDARNRFKVAQRIVFFKWNFPPQVVAAWVFGQYSVSRRVLSFTLRSARLDLNLLSELDNPVHRQFKEFCRLLRMTTHACEKMLPPT